MKCINENSKDWKDLVLEVGDYNARLAYVRNGNEIPSVDKAKRLLGISNIITLYKGKTGKLNIDGSKRSAHNVNGIFFSTDRKVSERYGEVEEINLDTNGLKIETISIPTNLPISEYRQKESKAINNSNADIIYLETIDTNGKEVQVILKNKALIRYNEYKSTPLTTTRTDVKYNSNGEVLAPNGNTSLLFKSIEQLEGITSKQQALELYKQTRSKEFKGWFGDSKVVDAQGEPLIVYHGTNEIFDEFNFSLVGKENKGHKSGMFFSNKRNNAKEYITEETLMGENTRNAVILPTFLRITNPLYQEDVDRFDLSPYEIEEENINDLERYNKEKLRQNNNYHLISKNHGKLSIIMDNKGNLSATKIPQFIDINIENVIDEIPKEVLDNFNKHLKEYRIQELHINNLKNNLPTLSKENIQIKGKDGVIQFNADKDVPLNMFGNTGEEGAINYVVFEPNQIKSVFNQGAFSKDNDNIYDLGTTRTELLDNLSNEAIEFLKENELKGEFEIKC